MKNILALLIFVFLLNGCNFAANDNQTAANAVNEANIENSQTEKVSDTGSKANVNQDIRKIDFKNFTYNPFCAGEEPRNVTVKDGEFGEEKQEDGYTDRFSFTIFSVNYGDVNGDGNEDAVILSNCNTGGTGQFTEGFIYELKNEKPSLITRIPGGDRAYGGLVEARIEKGILVIESNDVGEQGGACCPEFIVTSLFKFSGGKLVQTGKAERREIYPAQKVSFPKGASSTTVKVKFTKEDDRKRFSLGAKKGQILRVTSPDKIYPEIRKGDAAVKEGTGDFTATLNESGEFIIEVQFFTDTEKEVSVTIEIK
jgi:hypothetical protein